MFPTCWKWLRVSTLGWATAGRVSNYRTTEEGGAEALTPRAEDLVAAERHICTPPLELIPQLLEGFLADMTGMRRRVGSLEGQRPKSSRADGGPELAPPPSRPERAVRRSAPRNIRSTLGPRLHSPQRGIPKLVDSAVARKCHGNIKGASVGDKYSVSVIGPMVAADRRGAFLAHKHPCGLRSIARPQGSHRADRYRQDMSFATHRKQLP